MAKIFKLSHLCLYLFLNDSLFSKLQEYHQFHIYDNVPSAKNFPMQIFEPCKIDKILRFCCWYG